MIEIGEQMANRRVNRILCEGVALLSGPCVGVEVNGWSARRHSRIPHAAKVLDTVTDERGAVVAVVIEPLPGGLAGELLETRGRLREGEAATLLAPLFEAAATFGDGAPAQLSLWRLGLRANGEPVLLPGAGDTVRQDLSAGELAGRLLYRVLSGEDWDASGRPVAAACPGVDIRLQELIVDLLNGGDWDLEAISDRVLECVVPEPIDLAPSPAAALDEDAMTGEVPRGSFLEVLRGEQAEADESGKWKPIRDGAGAAGGSEPNGPSKLASRGFSKLAGAGGGDVSTLRRSIRGRAPVPGRPALLIVLTIAVALIVGGAALTAPLFASPEPATTADAASPTPAPDAREAAPDDPVKALETITEIRLQMFIAGERSLLDQTTVADSPARSADEKILEQFAAGTVVGELEMRVAQSRTVGEPRGDVAVVEATVVTESYDFEDAHGVVGTHEATSSTLAFELHKDDSERWLVYSVGEA